MPEHGVLVHVRTCGRVRVQTLLPHVCTDVRRAGGAHKKLSFTCLCSVKCVCVGMCEAHLLLKGCYMPGEHTLILSVVCLPLTGALLTLTHKDVCVCVCVCGWVDG